MTPSIVEFLNARLQEDEDTARSALPAEHECFHNETWKWWDSGDRVRVVSHCGCSTTERTDDQPDAERAHIARRVLREVEAKRAILAEHPIDDLGYCTKCWTARQPLSAEAPCTTLRYLAAVYADHEDWRP